MDLSYFTFASDNHSVKLKNPLNDKEKIYDISSCCDYLIKYHNSPHTAATDVNIFSKIEHWWKRKWQVSLDYYLSSPSEHKKQQTETSLSKAQQNIDCIFPDISETNRISPIQALLNRKNSPEIFRHSSSIISILNLVERTQRRNLCQYLEVLHYNFQY